MTIPSTQIMVLKYYFPLKEIRALGKMVDSLSVTENNQDEPGLSYRTRQQKKLSDYYGHVHNAKSNKEMLTSKDGTL